MRTLLCAIVLLTATACERKETVVTNTQLVEDTNPRYDDGTHK